MDQITFHPQTHAIVTGGAGFIGSHLSARLLALGCRVTILTRHVESPAARRLAGQGATVIAWDLASSGEPPPLDDIGPANLFFHFAANVSVTDPTVRSTNVEGTARALALIDALGGSSFIFASSIEAQGPGSNGDRLLSERDPARPVSVYGASKLEAEALVEGWNQGPSRRALILRIGNIYGPGSVWMLESSLMSLLGLATVQPNWNRLRHRTFQPLYVDDLVDAVLRAVSLELSGLYNVTGLETLSIESYFNLLGQLLDLSEPIEELLSRADKVGPTPKELAPDLGYFLMGDDTQCHRVYDSRALRAHIGDYVRWPIARGLAATLRWYHDCGRLRTLLNATPLLRAATCTSH